MNKEKLFPLPLLSKAVPVTPTCQTLIFHGKFSLSQKEGERVNGK
jgi:hypothetical protein